MDRSPLELPPDVVRRMVKDVLDRLLPWIERQGDEPVSNLTGSAKLAAAIRHDWPEGGEDWSQLFALMDRARQTSLQATSPGYLAYIPGGGIPHAAIADLYADLVNRYTGLWMPAPGFVQMEVDCVRWFCEMVGYPAGPGESGGLLTTGGSLANLGALVTARHHRLGPEFLDGVAYVTDQTHHSVQKACYVAGLSDRNLRTIPVGADHAMRVDALRSAIAEDRRAGRRPFLVVASAGSTPVGAVDPIAEIADACAAEGLWLHVDAAYGGFFQLTGRGRAALAGLDRADSITLDPHKGLFLPYGTGCLLVRRAAELRAAHAVAASYLPGSQDDAERIDLADLGPELSRDARGLRVWLPLRMHGFSTFRAALDEKLDLARAAADGVRRVSHVRMVSEPVLSLFAFRAEPPGVADLDRLNRAWLAATNQRQRVFLSGTVVADPASGAQIFVLRVCVLCFRTHAERIRSLVEDLEGALAQVLAG